MKKSKALAKRQPSAVSRVPIPRQPISRQSTPSIRPTGGALPTVRPDGPGCYTSLGYRSASVTRANGVVGVGASGETHVEADRLTLINQSREFYRNNSLYKGMIDRAISYIVGTGFLLKMNSRSESHNTKVERLWKSWWASPETRQILSGPRLLRQIAQELFLCGDTGLIKTDAGLVQHIEAEQISGSGKSYYQDTGILTDNYGRPVTFYVKPYGQTGVISNAPGTPYQPNSEFLFLTTADRPSSLRGVPPCQSAFATLHRINDVCDSEAIAWQMLARMAIKVEKQNAAELAFDSSEADPNAEGTELAQRITNLGYAMIFNGEKGETISGIDRNIPGKDFPQSLMMFLRLLGLPLGLPLEITLLDWTKSNYSQSKAVLEQAFQMFMYWQNLMASAALTPIFRWKYENWKLQGLISNRADGDQHEWIFPTFPWLDELKEAQAWGAKLDRSLTTHAHACKALNADREDLIELRTMEIRDAIERAKKISDEFKVNVPWEIFAGLRPGTDSGRPGGVAPNTSPQTEFENGVDNADDQATPAEDTE